MTTNSLEVKMVS